MLYPYRRHSEDCESELTKKGLTRREIAAYKRCDCQVWMKGKDKNNQYVRESCDTRDWSYAERVAIPKRMIRDSEEEATSRVRVTIEQAREKWLNKNLKPNTKRKYELASKVLVERLPPNLKWIDQITDHHIDSLIDQYRSEDKASRTINLYRGCLFNWFQYAQKKGWIANNPVLKVDREKLREDEEEPTLPLDSEGDANWRRIHAEIIPFLEQRKYAKTRGRSRSLGQHPHSFLVLLEFLYHTGLRVSDAVQFKPSEIEESQCGGSWTTRQTKTRDRVTVFLDPEIWGERLERLRDLPDLSGEGHVFFGGGDRENYINHHIRMPLRELGEKLGFPQSLRPHRFRDSFAVNQLALGVSLDDLKDLLGHRSIKTTEQHYLKYTKNRTNALERRLYAARAQARSIRENLVISIATKQAVA